VHFQLGIEGLPTVEQLHRGSTAPGAVISTSVKNSFVIGSLRWGDFVRSAHNGSVTIKVDLLSAPKSWKKQLFKGYFDGLTTIGDYSVERSVNAAALHAVEGQLNKMA
jgi:hypothetical protein